MWSQSGCVVVAVEDGMVGRFAKPWDAVVTDASFNMYLYIVVVTYLTAFVLWTSMPTGMLNRKLICVKTRPSVPAVF